MVKTGCPGGAEFRLWCLRVLDGPDRNVEALVARVLRMFQRPLELDSVESRSLCVARASVVGGQA